MLRFTKTICAIAVLTATSAFADIDSGLMAKYTFDNCDATDSSGNNNHGIITGNLTCTAGVKSNSFIFDGSSYISIKDSPTINPTSQLTVSFWIKPNEITSHEWSAIIYKGDESGCLNNRSYSAWLNHTGKYIHLTSAGDGNCQTSLNTKTITYPNQWIHYIGVIDRKNHKMTTYVNGKISSSQIDNFSSFVTNNLDLRIGFSLTAPSWETPFSGQLDEVRLYNRVLTATEISTLYNQGVALGGNINSMGARVITCTNNTTNKTVTIKATRKAPFNCEEAGLVVRPQDNISITVNGVVE